MFYLTKFDIVTVFGNPKIAKSKLICIAKIPRYFDRVGIHTTLSKYIEQMYTIIR